MIDNEPSVFPTDNEPFDEEYVREILEFVKFRILSRRWTRDQFYAACALDVNGGWRAEVDEAWRRYSKVGVR